MIPQATIDVLRSFNDISVEVYGIDCILRVPLNWNATEPKDVYATPEDYAFKEYSIKVFIEWKPDTRRLRRLGIFTENDLPIIAWFKNDPGVTIRSYIKVPIQYIPKEYQDTDEFEIVDILIRGMHDAIAVNAFRLAPRRVRTKIK